MIRSQDIHRILQLQQQLQSIGQELFEILQRLKGLELEIEFSASPYSPNGDAVCNFVDPQGNGDER